MNQQTLASLEWGALLTPSAAGIESGLKEGELFILLSSRAAGDQIIVVQRFKTNPTRMDISQLDPFDDQES